MKKITLVILILSKTILVFSQQNMIKVESYFHPFGINETDSKLFGLKGSIKSTIQKSYTAIDSFGIATKKSKIPNQRIINNFNKKGLLLEEITYRKKQLFTKKTNVYNKKGKKIENRSYYAVKDSLILSYIINFKNTKNNLNSSEHYSVYSSGNKQLDATQEYKYNKNGNLTETVVYLPNESIETKTIYKYYDKQNLWLVINKYSGNGNIKKIIKEYQKPKKTIIEEYLDKELSDTEIIIYDKNNYIIDKQSSDSENIFSKSSIFTFNKNGNTLKQIEKQTKYGTIEYEDYYTISYEYDKHMNWIKKIISVNGSYSSIFEREIIYFK